MVAPAAIEQSRPIRTTVPITAVAPTASGFVSVYPDGQPRPGVSNLNFVTNQTIPNLVVVPVVNGKVDFYELSGGVYVQGVVAGE